MNAKELKLDKMNAGPDLMGTWIYLVQKGINFDEIGDFMVSPTVDAIVSKSKSNIFTSRNMNIDKAITYWENGVPLNLFLNEQQTNTIRWLVKDPKMIATYWNMLTADQKLQFQRIIAEPKGDVYKYHDNEAYHSLVIRQESYDTRKYENITQGNNLIKFFGMLSSSQIDAIIDLADNSEIEAFNNLFSIEERKYISEFDFLSQLYDDFHGKPFRRFLNECKERAAAFESGQVNMEKVKAFKKIYGDAEELRVLGGRLGINQGMGTDFYSHYSYNKKLENFIMKKFKELDLLGTKGFKHLDFSSYKAFRDSLKIDLLHNYNFKTEEDRIRHQEYQAEMIRLGEMICSFDNIIEIEIEAKHYDSMIYALNTAVLTFRSAALKYNAVNDILNQLINYGENQDQTFYEQNNDGTFKTFSDDEVRGVQRYVGLKIIQKFLKGQNIQFKMKNGDLYYDQDGNLVEVEGNEKIFSINDKYGMVNFKMFVENMFDDNMDGDSSNPFYSHIIYDNSNDSITGHDYNYLRLDFDLGKIETEYQEMMREEILTNFYSLAYNPVAELTNNGSTLNILDMFALYNLIVHDGSYGKNTFTKLFDQSITAESKNFIYLDYLAYVGNIDNNRTEELELSLDEAALYIAPRFNGILNTKYHKKWDNKLKKFVYYQRTPKEYKGKKFYEAKLIDFNFVYESPSKLVEFFESLVDMVTNRSLLVPRIDPKQTQAVNTETKYEEKQSENILNFIMETQKEGTAYFKIRC